jgi:hypothetical protein
MRKTRDYGLAYEKNTDFDYKVLQKEHFTYAPAVLPFLPDLFSVRAGGTGKIRRGKGNMADAEKAVKVSPVP